MTKYFSVDAVDNARFLCIQVDEPEDINVLKNPETVITRKREITICYDYPLSHKVRITHIRKRGWTRRDICVAIQKDYNRIYYEEDCGKNRGQHGIWGHSIGDLVIESFSINPKTGLVLPSIGS